MSKTLRKYAYQACIKPDILSIVSQNPARNRPEPD